MNLEELLADQILLGLYHDLRRTQHGMLFSDDPVGYWISLGAALATAESLNLPLVTFTSPSMREVVDAFISTSNLAPRVFSFNRASLSKDRFPTWLQASTEGPYILALDLGLIPVSYKAFGFSAVQAVMKSAALRFFSGQPNTLRPIQTPRKFLWKRPYGGFRSNEECLYYLTIKNGELISQSSPLSNFIAKRDEAIRLDIEEQQRRIDLYRYRGRR